ncbi:hypothetical protein J0895_14290 [Phormidium pseudopriestleyi FRX01]|uniref:Transposase n=1 Tax=Phormidium pseudopriestleyi FRX01 TaxID=1759528 RepID=A0ABS3FTD3_9CYAN|nr:hypothetical protein [Phormidium pseudopriestleyi]MBO0350259.1 hypothetical protein [Phormidium pseudopriestleyi FRX01]
MLINAIGSQLYFALESETNWAGIQNGAELAIALSYLGRKRSHLRVDTPPTSFYAQVRSHVTADTPP